MVIFSFSFESQVVQDGIHYSFLNILMYCMGSLFKLEGFFLLGRNYRFVVGLEFVSTCVTHLGLYVIWANGWVLSEPN